MAIKNAQGRGRGGLPAAKGTPSANGASRANDTPHNDCVVPAHRLTASLQRGTLSNGLDQCGSLVHVQRGRTIVEGGVPVQHVFKVLSGGLRAIQLLADGRRHVSRFFVPGDLIGLGSGNYHAQTVEAVTEVTLVRYAHKHFLGFVDSSPLALHALLDLLDRERADAENLQLLVCRKNASERLATFLIAFAHIEESRLQVADAALRLTEVHLWMSRADIADHLGLTMETVSRTLAALRQRHIIALPTPQRVLVLNLAALHCASGDRSADAGVRPI
jgi:CRP/FNR family transcriptional regulator